MLALGNCKCPLLQAFAKYALRCGVLGAVLAASSVSWAADAAGGIVEQPLAPRPYPRGKTMFVQLKPEETGLKTENNYADPRMRGELYQEFETSSVGTGVTIGDYDGDGRPDVYVVSKTDGCRLFRNLGNYKFEDVTEKAGVGAERGVWNQGATFVDINNSGRLDIYVCRTNAPNLLYINQGDGTFKEMAHAYGLDVNDSSVMAAFSDYDRDGWLDVYIATNVLDITKHPNGQRGYLFHNNRDGTFTDVTSRAGITGETQSHSATWWDFDNDGWPDLYVANDYGVPDRLYHNNRDGTFTDSSRSHLPHTSFSSMGSDLGDVNNDGYIDFFVADMAATTHQRDHHEAADYRARATEPEEGSDEVPKYHRNALLLNTGTGRFQEGAFLANVAATDWTWSSLLEDLDNDGWLDLYATNGFPRDPGTDTVKRSMNAETPAERIRIMYASPQRTDTHLALRNLGNLEFRNVSAEWGLDQKGVAFGAAFGDLSGDGNLDLVYCNYHASAALLRNDCDSGHVANVYLRGTVSNRYGIGATVRIESALGIQVRPLTLSRGYMSSSEPMIHFGLGKDTSIRRMVVTWPSGHVQTFENLSVDRRFTVTEPSDPIPIPKDDAPPIGQFYEVGSAVGLQFASHDEPVNEAAVQRLIPMRLNRRGPAVAVGDILGNRTDSVVVGGTTLDSLRILTGGPSGFTSTDTSALFPVGPLDDGPVLLFDAEGKGREDLLVTRGGNALLAGSPEYQPRLLFNDGRGGFRPSPDDALPPLLINAGAVAAADFDHSGRLSVFIGGRVTTGDYPTAPTSALLANRGGKFEDVTDALAPGLRNVGMVTSALWSDVDGDGWPDLLLTLEWGTVKYFHNNQGKGFEDWSEKAGFAAAGKGWWTSIASADFNGDGRPDYVVGNVGLNTQYHADPDHPAVLFSGDFKGDGSSELIEAYYEGDKLYPWRSRRDVGAVIPSILKRFPSFDSYARATVKELFGEEPLARAERFEATELRSGVFLSQPDGTYRFEPLPRIAQISPLQGMVAADLDGDGHADIYAVQNSYAPIPAVGRYDGGLSQLLLGDGQGHFRPVPPAESGLVVPEDAKAVALLDIDQDGWPDFFVTRNDSSTLAFRNRGVAGHNPLRVVLRGPDGNPTGVGARITLELADGSKQTAEVFAGSGYYGQSTSACFFGYPDSNPPKRIRIRWPSGALSEHSVHAKTNLLTFSAPPP